MKPYIEHLKQALGNPLKARKSYMQERKWREDDWHQAVIAGLGDEIEAACRSVPYGKASL